MLLLLPFIFFLVSIHTLVNKNRHLRKICTFNHVDEKEARRRNIAISLKYSPTPLIIHLYYRNSENVRECFHYTRIDLRIHCGKGSNFPTNIVSLRGGLLQPAGSFYSFIPFSNDLSKRLAFTSKPTTAAAKALLVGSCKKLLRRLPNIVETVCKEDLTP